RRFGQQLFPDFFRRFHQSCYISPAAEFRHETPAGPQNLGDPADDALRLFDPMKSGVGKNGVEGFVQRNFSRVHHVKLQLRESLARLPDHFRRLVYPAAGRPARGDLRRQVARPAANIQDVFARFGLQQFHQPRRHLPHKRMLLVIQTRIPLGRTPHVSVCSFPGSVSSIRRPFPKPRRHPFPIPRFRRCAALPAPSSRWPQETFSRRQSSYTPTGECPAQGPPRMLQCVCHRVSRQRRPTSASARREQSPALSPGAGGWPFLCATTPRAETPCRMASRMPASPACSLRHWVAGSTHASSASSCDAGNRNCVLAHQTPAAPPPTFVLPSRFHPKRLHRSAANARSQSNPYRLTSFQTPN